jgi:WXG100 family type VII secretion target
VPGSRIRWDYDQLNSIAQHFAQQAESARGTLNALKQQMEVLEGGDWIGVGANAFYNEMHSAILPALDRLARALDEAARTTEQIRNLGKETEDAVAQILRRIEVSRSVVGNVASFSGATASAQASTSGGSGGGVLGGIGDFFGGMWDEGKNMVSGLGHMIAHPIDTAKGLYYGVTHPGAMWDALTKPFVDDWNSGHPMRAIGRGVLFAGSMVVGAKGIDKIAKVAEAAGAVGKIGELGELGKVGEVAKIAETAEAAGAVGKVGSIAETTATAARAAGFSQTEAGILGEAKSIMSSPQMQQIQAAAVQGEGVTVEVGGRIIQYEPGLPASGMTMFGENGFLIGREAFTSQAELSKTVLHELHRLTTSTVPEAGVTGATAASETEAAFNFANRGHEFLNKLP